MEAMRSGCCSGVALLWWHCQPWVVLPLLCRLLESTWDTACCLWDVSWACGSVLLPLGLLRSVWSSDVWADSRELWQVATGEVNEDSLWRKEKVLLPFQALGVWWSDLLVSTPFLPCGVRGIAVPLWCQWKIGPVVCVPRNLILHPLCVGATYCFDQLKKSKILILVINQKY